MSLPIHPNRVAERAATYATPATQSHALVKELWAIRGQSDQSQVQRIVKRCSLPVRWFQTVPGSIAAKGIERLCHERNVLVLRNRKSCFVSRFEHPIGRCARFYKLAAYNSCNFWCEYCYLYLTFRRAPYSTHFVNYSQMLADIEQFDGQAIPPVLRVLNLGELGDPLAVDDITGLSEELIPFMPRGAPRTKLLFLTKSDRVESLLGLEHGGQTVMSFSINTDAVHQYLEHRAPSPESRLLAARRVQDHGYEVRLRIDPVFYYSSWRRDYQGLADRIFETLRPARITIGGYRPANTLPNHIMTRFPDTPLEKIRPTLVLEGGKLRYPMKTRTEMFAVIVDALRRHDPTVDIALCKEDRETWEAAGLNAAKLCCNCLA